MIEGTRSFLCQAGLPPKCWHLAGLAFSAGANMFGEYAGIQPYMARMKKKPA